MARAAATSTAAQAAGSAALDTRNSSSAAPAVVPTISRLFSFLEENVSDTRHGNAAEARADPCTLPVAAAARDLSSTVGAFGDCTTESEDLLRDNGRDLINLSSYLPHPGAKTSGLRQKIAALELLVEEKHQQLLEFKKIIDEQDSAKQHFQQQMQQKSKAEMAQYEEALEKQLKTVDKLIADKTELSQKCEALAEQIQQTEQKSQEKLEEVRRRCEKEAERQHRMFVISERAKRETWQREKTQDIKEMTIKGLEPEIQRLMDRHRDDKKRLEEKMRRTIEELQRDCQEKLQLVKEHMARDEDENLERERAHHRRLMREQHEQFEKELREEREKHLADQTEKDEQWELQRQKLLAAAEDKAKAAVEEEQARGNRRLEDFRRELALLQQQHAEELEAMHQHGELKEAEWQSRLAEKIHEETNKRIEKIKEELTYERDKKLDAVIEKMGREQLEQQHQQKQKMEELLGKTRCEMEEQMKQTVIQNEKLKTAVRAKEAEKEALEARISQLDAIRLEKHEKIIECEARLELQAKQAREAVEEKEMELQKLTSALREQQENHKAELRAKEEDCLRLKREVCEAQEQIEKQKKDNDQQLEVLEAKIKQALWVKDAIICDLKEEMAALETKVAYFRDQQRKQREGLFGTSHLLEPSTEDKAQVASGSSSNSISSISNEPSTRPTPKSSTSKSCTSIAEMKASTPLIDEQAKPSTRQRQTQARLKVRKGSQPETK